MQMNFTPVIFGVLSAALTYRWMGFTGRVTKYTGQRVWLITMFAALVTAALWILIQIGLDRLPQKWAMVVPQAALAGLALYTLLRPASISSAEHDSNRRIQIGITIGTLVLIAICSILFFLIVPVG